MAGVRNGLRRAGRVGIKCYCSVQERNRRACRAHVCSFRCPREQFCCRCPAQLRPISARISRTPSQQPWSEVWSWCALSPATGRIAPPDAREARRNNSISGNRVVVAGSAMRHQLMSPNSQRFARNAYAVRGRGGAVVLQCALPTPGVGGARRCCCSGPSTNDERPAHEACSRSSQPASIRGDVEVAGRVTSTGISRGPRRPCVCLIFCSRACMLNILM